MTSRRRKRACDLRRERFRLIMHSLFRYFVIGVIVVVVVVVVVHGISLQ